MKLILLIFSLIPISANAQHIIEELYTFEDTYNPLFKSQSSVFTFNLLQIYDIGGTDTTLQFFANIADAKAVASGGSVGMALASGVLGGAALSSRTTYSIDRGYGEVVLNLKTSDEKIEQEAMLICD
jgi:hypothetical protein